MRKQNVKQHSTNHQDQNDATGAVRDSFSPRHLLPDPGGADQIGGVDHDQPPTQSGPYERHLVPTQQKQVGNNQKYTRCIKAETVRCTRRWMLRAPSIARGGRVIRWPEYGRVSDQISSVAVDLSHQTALRDSRRRSISWLLLLAITKWGGADRVGSFTTWPDAR